MIQNGMWTLFTARSNYKKRARFAAILWTLLIFFGCFLPGKDVPGFMSAADKWEHFILFAVFALLWLLGYPARNFTRLLLVFLAACALGWLVEELQGLLSFLGRSKDIGDIIADAIGSFLGVILFYIFAVIAAKKTADL
jgi:VanZ family protein